MPLSEKSTGIRLSANCLPDTAFAADKSEPSPDVILTLLLSLMNLKEISGWESIEEKQDYEIEVLDKVMNCFEKKFLKLFQESVYMKNPFFREESEIRLCEFSPKQFLMYNFSLLCFRITDLM